MTEPILRVEAAFGVAPLTVPSAGQWVDISAYCFGTSGRRGRDHELNRSQAGTAQIRLNNTDRRFDPLETSSPYYPNIVPMTQVRITETHLGIDYPVFYGYVEDWGQSWVPRPMQGTGAAECTVSAVDGFKILSLYQVAGAGVYEDAIIESSPDEYWKLSEAAGSGTAADSATFGVANNLTANAAQVSFGVIPSPLLGSETVADFPSAGNTPLRKTSANNWGDESSFALYDGMTLEFWIKVDAYPSAGNLAGIFSVNDGTTSPGAVTIELTETGQLKYSYREYSTGTTRAATTTMTISTATWTHIALSRTTTTCAVYKNAVHVEDLSYSGTGSSANAGGGTVTIVLGASEDESSPYFDGKLAHFAVWSQNLAHRVLTQEEISAHYSAKLASGIGTDAGSQITAILDSIGWPSPLRQIDTGDSVMQDLDISGSALESILSIGEDSEQGLVQMTADGKVLFHSRSSVQGHTTSTMTFSDTGSVGHVPYQDLRVRYDDQDLYTIVITQNTGGVAQTSTAASATQYGPRVLSKTGLRLASDTEAGNMAAYLAARYDAPALRVTGATFPAASDDGWPKILGRDTHHDLVTIIRTPPGGGSPIIQGGHIEGIQWNISPPFLHQWAFSLVPQWETSYWELGTDAFNTDTVLAW